MPETPITAEKILPCLLDRLSDEAPGTPPGAASSQRGISLKDYREHFLRDLAWLLNTKCHLPSEGLSEFPQVERSVFNFGMPDPSGRSIREPDILALERQIREAILRFEPRILPGSLRVKAVAKGERSRTTPNTVSFEIRGSLWASPLPESFHVKTDIDLENGQCVF